LILKVVGKELELSEDRVIFWSDKEVLFIADLHIGKTSHFRKSGIAIPTGIIDAEIARLEALIKKYHPKRVFFLGDLFHSDLNHEWTLFDHFLNRNSTVEFILIKGNHDILPKTIYDQSILKIEEEPFQLDSFILSHHPLIKSQLKEGYINLCGHIHPGLSIKTKGRSYLKLPCFYHKKNQLILPAFGKLTGLAKINPSKEESVFVTLNNSVKEIKLNKH